MNVHHFSLGFLGGPVDLQRMLVALAEHYTASLEDLAEYYIQRGYCFDIPAGSG